MLKIYIGIIFLNLLHRGDINEDQCEESRSIGTTH